MIRIPQQLQPYLDFEEGKLIEVDTVPPELQDELEEFRKVWEVAHNPNNLAEY